MYVCKDSIRWRFAVGADAGSGLVAEMDILFSILGHLYYVLSLMY